MGQKAAPAFNYPEKNSIFKKTSRVFEAPHKVHDLDEVCAVAHLSDALDGLRKNKMQ
jgi:hypothetical protein